MLRRGREPCFSLCIHGLACSHSQHNDSRTCIKVLQLCNEIFKRMVEYIFACSCWWGVRKVSSRSIPKTPHSSNLSSPRLPYSVGGMYDDGKGSPRYHPTHTFRRGLKVQRCIHKIVDSQFPPPKKKCVQKQCLTVCYH